MDEESDMHRKCKARTKHTVRPVAIGMARVTRSYAGCDEDDADAVISAGALTVAVTAAEYSGTGKGRGASADGIGATVTDEE
jgi:hypothetical protein